MSIKNLLELGVYFSPELFEMWFWLSTGGNEDGRECILKGQLTRQLFQVKLLHSLHEKGKLSSSGMIFFFYLISKFYYEVSFRV